ncbi:hypothetical protein SAMN02746011_01025 [Globicatella sulfidifaciens DSM 15739]|uniref:Uncharacterized protein n=2 Tax=Globicatella sulfidifaciens TaxID=136093 RepID=A0A1T4LBL1_9LACT|nr:hypothetical protein SAMN02746011_01025 [Globicatella sulfidifaciens DSM 15739]
MYDLYFEEKMMNQDKFVHDYLRFAKPVDFYINWDNMCAMIVRIINLTDDNFYTLFRHETKDGFEHSFEFQKIYYNNKTYTYYIGHL